MAEAGGRERQVFPDQGKKLIYLITIRGDQRTPSPRNRLLALGEQVTRNGANHPSPIARNQAQLAEALNVHASTVNRWIKGEQRIPLDDLTEICRIFAVDEVSFKELDLAAFQNACRTPAAAPTRVGADWRAMLRRHTPGVGRIMLRDPSAGIVGEIRYAGIAGDDAADDPLPEVPAATPFWMEFVSPRGANGALLWAGWHMLLFNHDLNQQGFRCLLPSYGQHAAFAAATFPARGPLALPRKPVLTHPDGDLGDFEMVLVVSHEPLPGAIVAPLATITAQGLAIEDALRQLAEWIDPRILHTRAAVARAPYRVIAATTRETGTTS